MNARTQVILIDILICHGVPDDDVEYKNDEHVNDKEKRGERERRD